MRFASSLAPILAVVGLAALVIPACGGDGGGGDNIDVDGGGLDTGNGDTGPLDDGGGFDFGTGCTPGTPCGTAGLCNAAGGCCEPAAAACGSKCCGTGQVCYAGACVTPGKACRSVDDCAEGETCDPSIGGGDAGPPPSCGDAAPSPVGRCVPRPPTCPGGDAGVDGGADAGPCVEACEWRPPVGTFDAVTEWSWPFKDTPSPAYNQVMASVVVGPLTDDNCDGKYDEKDTPAIVFNSYTGAAYSSDGILRAVTGKGKRLWDATEAGARTVPGASIALGELDPTSPGPEVVTCATDHQLLVFSAAGKVLWKSADPKIDCNYTAPALGDVDGDGVPEILLRYTLVSYKTKKVLFQGRTATHALPTSDHAQLYDIDGDGDLDIVGGNVVYKNDGAGAFSVLWDASKFAAPFPDGYVAIADLDLDGQPDIVVVHSLEQTLYQIRAVRGIDGKLLWGPFTTNPLTGTLHGGGPPTVADFDGDGKPDIGMAGGYSYNVFEGATGKLKWAKVTTDTSSRVTGSSVFDFDGDGKAEVVYADERNLHVYEGPTGKELLTLCNPSGTLWEYPLVVDVDGDDQAEIILVANDMWWGCGAGLAAGTGPTGLRVLGSKSGSWVRTRRIWNQHGYHVTNVNDDGTIPVKETPNWKTKGLNDFRQNVQPRGLFDAPNAVVELDGSCSVPATLRATVKNIGLASMPAGVTVSFYEGTPGSGTKIGTGKTVGPIAPGGAEIVDFKWDTTPAGWLAGSIQVYAVVADDAPTTWHECKTTDNTSKPYKKKCAG